ncbi:hypothetical protein [Corynebacterium camporealensis]
MHYTSWDRSDNSHPVLLVEEGPETLGTFSEHSADIDGEFWRLDNDPKMGASATLPDDRVFRIAGNLGKDKRLEISLDGRTFAFVMENSGEWIVDDVNEHKVAQFSTKNRGLRQAILEFDEDTKGLTQDEVIALSWFSRLVQEERTKGTAAPIIISLVLASIVAVAALFT